MGSGLPVEICIFVLMASMLFYSPHAFAQEQEPPIVNIDFDIQGVIDAVNSLLAGLTGSLEQIPQAVTNTLTGYYKSESAGFLSPLLVLMKEMVTSNPDPETMRPWHDMIITLISSFYLLLFLIVGFMFLFSSFDSKRRVSAKHWFKNAAFLIVAVNASFLFYSLFLAIGSGIANYLWAPEIENIFSFEPSALQNIFLITGYMFTTALAFVTLFIRYFALAIGTMLFPIGVFFYFIPPLQGWGKIILNVLGAFVLMQFVDVIILIGTNAVLAEFAGFEAMVSWAPLMAFTLIAFTNSLMILFAGIKAIFSALQEAPELNAVVNVVGGPIIAGAKLAVA